MSFWETKPNVSACSFFILRFPKISPSCVVIFFLIFSPWQVPLTSLLFTDLLLSTCHEKLRLVRKETRFHGPSRYSSAFLTSRYFSHPQIVSFHTLVHTLQVMRIHRSPLQLQGALHRGLSATSSYSGFSPGKCCWTWRSCCCWRSWRPHCHLHFTNFSAYITSAMCG